MQLGHPILTHSSPVDFRSALAGACAGVGLMGTVLGSLLAPGPHFDSEVTPTPSKNMTHWQRVLPVAGEGERTAPSRTSLDRWIRAFASTGVPGSAAGGSLDSAIFPISNQELPAPRVEEFVPRRFRPLKVLTAAPPVAAQVLEQVLVSADQIASSQEGAWQNLSNWESSGSLVSVSAVQGFDATVSISPVTTVRMVEVPRPVRVNTHDYSDTLRRVMARAWSVPVAVQAQRDGASSDTFAARAVKGTPVSSNSPEAPQPVEEVAQAIAATSVTDPAKAWDELMDGQKVWDAFQVSSKMPFYGEQVAGATAKVFSAEGDYRTSQQAWIVTEGGYSLPTLQWLERSEFERSNSGLVRALSPNSSSLLAALKGTALRSDLGIVFGMVPAGYSVALVGSLDSPLYLSADGREAIDPSATSASDHSRWFAFVNTQVGVSQVLLLDSHSQQPQGVVTAPVIAGGATFLELSYPQVRSVAVEALDARKARRASAGSAFVRVVGWSEKSEPISKDGKALLRAIPQIGTYPLYLEVSSKDGFPHRYRLGAEESKLDAFVFSQKQVESWVGQLEGGVDPRSSLVVGAVPVNPEQAAAQELDLRLQALNQTEDEAGDIQPEIYQWLADGAEGVLSVDINLEAGLNRVVGTQILPGAYSLKTVNSRDGKTLWSQWVISSPGVIQVIAP